MAITNQELIKEWKQGEERQKCLWREILSRGLYLDALGIDRDRKDTSWRNPPSATRDSQREFAQGCHGIRAPGAGRRLGKREAAILSAVNADDFT